jgi:hypothetical protein
MNDAGMWLGAPGGFVRADGTPKPSYDRLHHLVNNEWGTPPTMMATDAEGRLRFNGFLGDYRITYQDRSADLVLAEPGESHLSAALA